MAKSVEMWINCQLMVDLVILFGLPNRGKNSNQQIHEWLQEEEISDPDINEIEDFSRGNIDGVSAEAVRKLDQLQPMNAKPKYDH